MSSIWVICIPYDGLWDDAGYFISEEAANQWIKDDHVKQKARFRELKAVWCDKIDGAWEEPEVLEFCSIELKINE